MSTPGTAWHCTSSLPGRRTASPRADHRWEPGRGHNGRRPNWNWHPATRWWWSVTACWTSLSRWRTSPTPSGGPRSRQVRRRKPPTPSWPWLLQRRPRTTSRWSWSAASPKAWPRDPLLDPPGGGADRPDRPELHRLALDVLAQLGRLVDRPPPGGGGNLQPHRRHALRHDRVEAEDPQGCPGAATRR